MVSSTVCSKGMVQGHFRLVNFHNSHLANGHFFLGVLKCVASFGLKSGPAYASSVWQKLVRVLNVSDSVLLYFCLFLYNLVLLLVL